MSTAWRDCSAGEAFRRAILEEATELLNETLEAEAVLFVRKHERLRDAAGRKRVVRNGFLPSRVLEAPFGPVIVRPPRIRDRGGERRSVRISFSSALMPTYVRRMPRSGHMFPAALLDGILRRDCTRAVAALLGLDDGRFPPALAHALGDAWATRSARVLGRDLSTERFRRLWAHVVPSPRDADSAKSRAPGGKGARGWYQVILAVATVPQVELIGLREVDAAHVRRWGPLIETLDQRGLRLDRRVVCPAALVRVGTQPGFRRS